MLSHCSYLGAGVGLLLRGAAVCTHSSSISTVAARHFHAASPAASPQYGGYLRTGTAATAFTGQSDGDRYLITGACGQVGTELVPFIRSRVGTENVIASDVKTSKKLLENGPFVYCDVQDKDNLTRIILENGITYVVHLATLLSAVGERNPQLALRINTAGIQNVLDLAATHGLKVYSPSTIAVFGKTSPRVMTPDDTIMQPNTMYGITKVHQELLGSYYRERFGVDYRSLRYPGIISAKALPGGGTTDYAVEIFHAALKPPHTYTCFLNRDAALPMMYMADCLEATWQLMSAPQEALTRSTYNVTAMSFSPEQLGEAIRREVPSFTVTYTPDFRDTIARTWPDSLDDSNARRDWGWQPKYDLEAMTKDMLHHLAESMQQQQQQAAAKQQQQRTNGSRATGAATATNGGATVAGTFMGGPLGVVQAPAPTAPAAAAAVASS